MRIGRGHTKYQRCGRLPPNDNHLPPPSIRSPDVLNNLIMSPSATNYPSSDLALKADSLILVTGSTGYIASHITYEALALGYRVRGTVRSPEKATTSREVSQSCHPNYSTVVIPDIGDPNAFDDVLHDVDGIIHVATETSLDPSAPARVMRSAREATVNLLKAAAKVPSVRRIVYTSSSTAATLPKLNVPFHIDGKMWNRGSLDMVQRVIDNPKLQASSNLGGFEIYAASKTAAELAAWEFVRTQSPQFVLNVVLPNFNVGKILPGVTVGITGQSVIDTFHGQPRTDLFPPQYFVDVRDDARVHIGALIDKTVENQRLFAFARPFNWNDILASIRRARPGAKVLPDIEGLGRDLSTVDNEPAEQLLKKWFSQEHGWTSTDDSVRDVLEGF